MKQSPLFREVTCRRCSVQLADAAVEGEPSAAAGAVSESVCET